MGADQEQGGRGGSRSGDYLEGGSDKSRRQKGEKVACFVGEVVRSGRKLCSWMMWSCVLCQKLFTLEFSPMLSCHSQRPARSLASERKPFQLNVDLQSQAVC